MFLFLIIVTLWEPSGLLIIVAPLVFPIIAIALEQMHNTERDPIHLGIMMVVNMEIGMRSLHPLG